MSKFSLPQLNELVEAKIISEDIAQQISNHYLNNAKPVSNRFTAILSILGALLVGLGIVLFVAHNWDELNKMFQTIFAFLPLLIGQIFCFYTKLYKNDNTVWKESCTVILFFAIGSCIALVSQIYHIEGSLSKFIFVWMLLSVPLVYIMPSSLVSLLYIAGITWYACINGYSLFSTTTIPYWYPLLLLFIVPHYYKYAENKRESNFFHLHNWFLVFSVVIAFGTFSQHHDSPRSIFTAYIALFAVLYLVGNSTLFKESKLFANPSLISGTIGILVCLMAWSSQLFWREDIFHSEERGIMLIGIITIIFLITGIYLLFKNSKKQDSKQIDLPGFSALFFTLCVWLFSNTAPIGIFLINLWILAVAVYYIRKGALLMHFGILNFGLLIIATLAVMRFFDDNIPFIWRGLFFLTTGVGFFIANSILIKKKKINEV